MYKWLASLLIIVLASTACGNKVRNEPVPSPVPSALENAEMKTRQAGEATKKEITDVKATAAQLEQIAKSVNGVKDANCVILGNTAIVGLDLDGHLDRKRVGTIKYSVAEALHNDPYGIDALVTADIDIADRLREMGADIRNGRPITGFAEELSDIIGRIIPQMPREVTPAEEMTETVEPNSHLAPGPSVKPIQR